MKKTKPISKVVFAKPTEPMRRVPESKWVETVDPAFEKINTDGWARLYEILNEAQQDKRIASSVGASDFLELMCELAEDSTKAHNAIQALRPLVNIMAAQLLKDNKGRHSGGETMKQRKLAHTADLEKAVVSLLGNPATSDWSNPKIARWLMEPARELHKSKGGIKLGLQTMSRRVKEIREEYKSGKLTN